MCACDFNHKYVFELGILNQTIRSLAQCGIVKRFEKPIEFLLRGLCTVIADFEILCIGRVCQEKIKNFRSQRACRVSGLTWFSIIFATWLCAVCFMSWWWVSWKWSCWWRNVSSPCLQSPFAVAVSPSFLRFDLTGDCSGMRLSIQGRTAQSHMERSAKPDCGRAAFGLAKNSLAWVLHDLVCRAIFPSCALMRFFTVGHQVCDLGLLVSSTHLKTISWPRPPGYRMSVSSLSLSAPVSACLSASSWSGSPEWPWTFTKRVREDASDGDLNSRKMSRPWLCAAMPSTASSACVLDCWPRTRSDLMMMIAFITMKSSLLPLIEGLCAQIYFGFEISVVLLTSWGIAASCHMTTAPMAGSFVIDLAVTVHQWLPPDNLFQSTLHFRARPAIVAGMVRRWFDQASIGLNIWSLKSSSFSFERSAHPTFVWLLSLDFSAFACLPLPLSQNFLGAFIQSM